MDVPEQPAQEHRILYIDDNPANLRLVEQIFERRADYQVLTTTTPSIGLQLARSQMPDCILLDINMPDQDGYAVLRELRQSAETAGIPVLAVSGDATRQQREKALEAGFHHYLTKPINIAEMQSCIEEIVLVTG